MHTFESGREAKEYIVGRILLEAQREGVPLSEVERKMLYFTETAWSLPDIMEVSQVFDAEYDQAEYEKKIAGLISRLRKTDSKDDSASWADAVRVLETEDHYVLVMVGAASRLSGFRMLKKLLLGK